MPRNNKPTSRHPIERVAAGGQVERLVAGGRQGSRIDVYAGGQKVGRITPDQLLSLGLSKGSEWDKETAEAVYQAAVHTEARDRAVGVLAMGGKSRKALVEKLVRERGLDRDVVEKVADRLEQSGILNEREYATSLARSAAAKGIGERGILYLLKRKRVEGDLAEQIAHEAAEEAGADPVMESAKKQWKKLAGMERQKRRTRMWGWLARRGVGNAREIMELCEKGEKDDNEEPTWPDEG